MAPRAGNKSHQSPAAWGQEALVDPMSCGMSRTEVALLPAVRPSADRGDRMTEGLYGVLRGPAWVRTKPWHGVPAGLKGESELSETIGSGSAPSPSQVCKGVASDTTRGASDTTRGSVDFTSSSVDSFIEGCVDLIDRFHTCVLHGDDRCAERLLCAMESQNIGMSADTYNLIIHSRAKAGDVSRVERYLQRMSEKGFEPNLKTFNCMILACAPSGDRVRAGKLLVQILSQGMRPDSATYASICKVFAHDGLVSEIAEIMIHCEACAIPLNGDFYAALIAACGASDPAGLYIMFKRLDKAKSQASGFWNQVHWLMQGIILACSSLATAVFMTYSYVLRYPQQDETNLGCFVCHLVEKFGFLATENGRAAYFLVAGIYVVPLLNILGEFAKVPLFLIVLGYIFGLISIIASLVILLVNLVLWLHEPEAKEEGESQRLV